MRVVVNQLPALGRKTGVGHYIAEVLRCLRAQAGADQVDAFPSGWVQSARGWWDHLRDRLEPAPRALEPGQPRGRPALAPLRQAAVRLLRVGGRELVGQYFRASHRHGRYDLYHETNFIPLPSDLPTVVTLHDLSVVLHPEWHPVDRVAHFERHFHKGLARCEHFFSISEFGRQEIIRTLNIPSERVTCTYMGIRPSMKPLPAEEVAARLRQLGLPPRYLLCLGTIEPRKNLLVLLQAYCRLPAPLREHCPLLLVGTWGWNTAAIADFFFTEARHRGVLHLGYLAEEYLPAIYNGARALAYPSLYEGFGLPPVEMAACGGAVLASTAGALVETVGTSAHLIDPHDVDGWQAALARVIRDDDCWQELRRGAASAAQAFTWERCAADTWRVYRRLAGTDAAPAHAGRAA
jgi:alpha-1,3-rhamnosyl/mannosyltransferase